MNSRTESTPRVPIARSLGLAVWLAATPVTSEEPAKDATASVEILVENVASEQGVIVVALTSSAAQFDSGDAFVRSDDAVAIDEGRAERTFEEVPLGVYAVKVFHDENGNGDLDTNFVGYPTEAFGFSNDAMGRFGPPSFEEAAFAVETNPTRVRISLR